MFNAMKIFIGLLAFTAMSFVHAKDIASEAVASYVGLSEHDFKNPPASARQAAPPPEDNGTHGT